MTTGAANTADVLPLVFAIRVGLLLAGVALRLLRPVRLAEDGK